VLTSHIQKFKQRKTIVNENKYRNPPTWWAISTMVEALDAAGMSGEETEADSSSRAAKRMVVLKIPWLNPEITKLLHSVDTYATAVDDECFKKSQQGNPGYAKSTKTGETKSCPAVRKLPSNWYNEHWYGGLSDAQRASLLTLAERTLPCLVSIFFVLSRTLKYLWHCRMTGFNRPSSQLQSHAFIPKSRTLFIYAPHCFCLILLFLSCMFLYS
jgi:hypothetical protein